MASMVKTQTLQRVGTFVRNHKIAFGGTFLAIAFIFFILSFNRVRRKILRHARKWVNVKEISSNAGWDNSTFQKKMEAVGWKNGQEWCAYFVKMIILSCCKSGSDAYKFWQSHLTGGTQWNWATLNKEKNSKYFEISKKPIKGSFVIYQNNSDSSKGHTEFVEKVFSDGSYQVISGNSPFEGGKSGQGVVRKKRSKTGYSTAHILGFIKILKI